MSDETSFCKHCKRFVPTTTFTLHSTHCERFIQICTKCQEPFPKNQIEEHDNEVHKEIECKDCNQKVEVREQINHLKNHCPKRLISCEYCEVQCIAGNIEDHELACGSRTEVCDICRNYVLVRMLKIHEGLHNNSAAATATQIPSNIPSESKEKVLNVENKNVHDVHIPKFRNVICQNILQASATLPTSQQHSKIKRNSNIERSNISAVTQHIEDKHSLLPCEFCGTLYTIASLEKHQVLCSSNLEICSRCQEYFTSVQLTSHVCSPSLTERDPLAGSIHVRSNIEDEYWSRYVEIVPAVKEGKVDEEDSIPCENCGSLFPISCLELHEISCKFSSFSTKTGSAIYGNETPIQPRTTIDENYWSQYANVAPTIEDKMVEEANIPCENCGISFPLSLLELHEVSCKFSSAASTRKETMTSKTGITVAQENPKSKSHPVDEVTFLPCSFCNMVISSNILEMHEARCSSFSKQQMVRSQVLKSSPKKNEVKNTRSENDSQRALRENTLLATENRLPNTPKIQQSQYIVAELPDGREILKKRNPTINSNGLDAGHILGRSTPQHEFIDNGSSFRPTAVSSNDNLSGINKGIKKSLSQQSNLVNYPVTTNRARNHCSTMKPLSNDSTEMRLSKKPNTAFTNYAYQPDAGNKLGHENNSTYDKKYVRIAKTSTSRLQPGNTSVRGQPNPRDGEVNSELQQQNARDRTNEVLLGARPKRPQQ